MFKWRLFFFSFSGVESRLIPVVYPFFFLFFSFLRHVRSVGLHRDLYFSSPLLLAFFLLAFVACFLLCMSLGYVENSRFWPEPQSKSRARAKYQKIAEPPPPAQSIQFQLHTKIKWYNHQPSSSCLKTTDPPPLQKRGGEEILSLRLVAQPNNNNNNNANGYRAKMSTDGWEIDRRLAHPSWTDVINKMAKVSFSYIKTEQRIASSKSPSFISLLLLIIIVQRSSFLQTFSSSSSSPFFQISIFFSRKKQTRMNIFPLAFFKRKNN